MHISACGQKLLKYYDLRLYNRHPLDY